MRAGNLMLLASVSMLSAGNAQTISYSPPQGELTIINKGSPIPKGWVECVKTHAAARCETLAKAQPPNPEADFQYLIKLPKSGSVDDLNKFVDSQKDKPH